MRYFIFLFLFFSGCMHAQQVLKIGTIPYTIISSAALEVESNNKGFLLPRMSQAQRNAIVTPATGLVVYCTDCGGYGELEVYNGTSWVNMVGGVAAVPVPTITNPTTNRIWMDRNLGASQVATSSTDTQAYGDLYQWGRKTDGHEKRNSGTSTAPLTTFDQNSNLFIISNSDWLNPSNSNLWQGVNGNNNPCPASFRIPTQAEWQAEIATWQVTGNASDRAFNSLLKLPLTGFRDYTTIGPLFFVGSAANYWTSTIGSVPETAIAIYFSTFLLNDTGESDRSIGSAVRCIKD